MYSEQKQALAAELSFKHPAVLAVSGSAGSGKTALLATLLPVLKSRGLKVGVIREADDLRLPAETDRLHEAGAEGVAVSSCQSLCTQPVPDPHSCPALHCQTYSGHSHQK